MDFEINSVDPIFGDNYKTGYIGFTYDNDSVVSKGIAYFTRWAQMSDIKVSHAFIVTGENECIEALGSTDRVGKADIHKYFDKDSTQVFFRKPRDLTIENGHIIAQLALDQEGKAYDHSLIAAQFLSGNFIGHWINKLTGDIPDKLISAILNSDDEWICSELAAYCLDEIPEYHDKGILAHPNERIDPQELFEDSVVFQEWNRQ